MRIALPLTLLCAVALSTAACKPDLIPGTQVEDTEENREVLEFLTRYRQAMIDRQADGVLGLCARDYFEDNGTVEQEDDYGFDALGKRLKADFERTKEIQLEIIVQAIERPTGDDGPVRVAYRYNQRALVTFPVGDKWISLTDVNRLVLQKDEAAGFLIVSGL